MLCDGILEHSDDIFDENDVSSKFCVMHLYFAALSNLKSLSPFVNVPESQSIHYFCVILAFMVLILGYFVSL